MAKPIAPTPILKGKDAEMFIKRMEKPLSTKEKDFVQRAKKAYEKNPF